MIFDSDVLIWFFRGFEPAKEIVRKNTPFSISAVTYMELLQGALNKQELLNMKKFLKQSDAKVILINEEITRRAMEYIESFALSDSMELADALIAATVVENEEKLCTANNKHYKCIPNLQIDIFTVN